MKINICCSSSSSSITWKSVNCLSQTGSAQFSLSLHRVVNKARSSSHLQIISVSCSCSQRKAALSCYCAASQPGEGWGRRWRKDSCDHSEGPVRPQTESNSRPAHRVTSAASPSTAAKPAQALLVLRGTMEAAQVAF